MMLRGEGDGNCGRQKSGRLHPPERRGRAAPKRRSFLVRKDGHVFAFVYPPEHERAAVMALAGCPKLDPADVLALACYLGHDPLELGLVFD